MQGTMARGIGIHDALPVLRSTIPQDRRSASHPSHDSPLKSSRRRSVLQSNRRITYQTELGAAWMSRLTSSFVRDRTLGLDAAEYVNNKILNNHHFSHYFFVYPVYLVYWTTSCVSGVVIFW